MQSQAQKDARAERSRINGAKSRGPITPRGKDRARTAPLKHGLYASEPNLLPSVEEPAYAQFREHYQQIWQPANQYLADKVDDLAAYRWELTRLRAVRRQYLARVFSEFSHTAADGLSIVCETEIHAGAPGGTLDRFDYRIRRCNLEISRVERDLFRLHNHFSQSGASHNPLQTNSVEPEITQVAPAVAWAEETFDLALDPHQAEILTADAPETLVSAARFSGKTTALALRALYTSIHHPGSQIVCLSPNRALRREIAEKAVQIGHKPANILYEPHPAATLVLVDDAADMPAIDPAAQTILAATPNGARGAFYTRWQSPGANRVFAPASRSSVITEDLIRRAQKQLPEAACLQEFHCEFLENPQPRCRLLPLTQ